jgi:hypothetical protein
MRNISDKICREIQNTHLIFNIFSENLVVYEIILESLEEPDRLQTTMQ